MATQPALFQLPPVRRPRRREALERRDGLTVQDVEVLGDRLEALRRLADRARRRALRYRRHRDRLVYRKCRRRWTARVRDAEAHLRRLEAELGELGARLRAW